MLRLTQKNLVLLLGRGVIRRPGLILKNEDGIYDHIAIYKSKKESEPMYTIKKGEMKVQVIDEAIKGDKKYICNRNMKLLRLAEDGSQLKNVGVSGYGYDFRRGLASERII